MHLVLFFSLSFLNIKFVFSSNITCMHINSFRIYAWLIAPACKNSFEHSNWHECIENGVFDNISENLLFFFFSSFFTFEYMNVTHEPHVNRVRHICLHYISKRFVYLCHAHGIFFLLSFIYFTLTNKLLDHLPHNRIVEFVRSYNFEMGKSRGEKPIIYALKSKYLNGNPRNPWRGNMPI